MGFLTIISLQTEATVGVTWKRCVGGFGASKVSGRRRRRRRLNRQFVRVTSHHFVAVSIVPGQQSCNEHVAQRSGAFW